jgi:hypothetical protein
METRIEARFSLSQALLRPERTLPGLLDGSGGAQVVLSALHGATLVPALFRASEGTKFEFLWGNPLTGIALGIVFGLFWVQLVAFPAALTMQGFGSRAGFAETRMAVALSLLPATTLMFGYWLVRLAQQPSLASDLLVFAWPIAALWSLRNLMRALGTFPPRSRGRAAASAGLAYGAGIWVSLGLGLVPFVLTFLVMAAQSKLFS